MSDGIFDNTIELITKYIIKYPEDAIKWIEFMDDTKKSFDSIPTIYPSNTFIQEIKVPSIIDNIEITEETVNILCPYCKNRLDYDETIPKITLLCGHTYHTVCFQLLEHYHDQRLHCIISGCSIDTYSSIYRIVQLRRKLSNVVEDVFISSQLDRKDFKQDLKGLKKDISLVRNSVSNLKNKEKNIRKNIIHKHIHEIRQIQNDINIGSSILLKKSNEYKECKNNIRLYRRKAAAIYRKYHISLRDIIDQNLIKMNWRIRSILERHGQPTSKYRFGIRITPGKNPWKDNLE
jgi:hypothetical protein